jgi:hypothetical protein
VRVVSVSSCGSNRALQGTKNFDLNQIGSSLRRLGQGHRVGSHKSVGGGREAGHFSQPRICTRHMPGHFLVWLDRRHDSASALETHRAIAPLQGLRRCDPRSSSCAPSMGTVSWASIHRSPRIRRPRRKPRPSATLRWCCPSWRQPIKTGHDRGTDLESANSLPWIAGQTLQ